MKKISFLIAFFAIALAAFTQQKTTSPTLTKLDYLKKSKHQKIAAWILLGGGVFTATLGTAKFNFAGSEGEVDNTPYSVLLVAGLTAIGTSIPFFIASSKNKKKAMSLSFKNEAAPQLLKGSFVYQPLPSLSLKIHL